MFIITSLLFLLFISLILVYGIRWFVISNSTDYYKRFGESTIFTNLHKKEGLRALWAFIVEYIYYLLHLLMIIIDYIVSIYSYLLKRSTKDIPPLSQQEKGIESKDKNPIIMIHGYMVRAGTMWVIKRRLISDGWKEIYMWDYIPPYKEGIPYYAQRLKEKVNEILERSGAEKVDMVCHSMGGLVARHYISHLGGDIKVKRLVTIGTPHNGSGLWSFSIGRSGKDMRPGSEFLMKLGSIPPGILTTSIYTTFDELVIPYQSCKIEGEGVINREEGYIGHAGLLFSKRIYNLIKEGLSRE
ncbi:MAG: alpha/beta hydrolase [Nitrospinae bacterium]|nr:alpha/beta hydrolase [Nitrospinota bacterium]